MSKIFFGCVFSTSALVSFNAALWQVSRRNEKQQTMENHKNMHKKPLTDLPGEDQGTNDWEFHAIELQGTFDNEGTVLVGPRHFQSTKGSLIENEKRGGFAAITPFEVAGSGGKFVMVNRGWVPIDAGKNRMTLSQYVGEGFAPANIRGVLRKEEVSNTMFGNPTKDNFQPLAAGMSWFISRPYDIALEYYGKRWGRENIKERKLRHGAHHYLLEIVEDFSGNDQRMVKGVAYPKRRDAEEISYIHLAPFIHACYAFFWTFAAVGSVYCARKGFSRQTNILRRAKKINEKTGEYEGELQKESQAFYEKMKSTEGAKK